MYVVHQAEDLYGWEELAKVRRHAEEAIVAQEAAGEYLRPTLTVNLSAVASRCSF